MTNSIGAVCSGSTLFASILNSSVMLGHYLQQTTSEDDLFRCIFFLGALRVNRGCEDGLKSQVYMCKYLTWDNSLPTLRGEVRGLRVNLT